MIVSIVLFGLSALIVPMVRNHILIVSLFLISSLVAAMLPDFFFRGIEKMKTITVRTVIVRVLSLLLVAFVHDDSQILLIPIAFIVGNGLALIVTLIAIGKTGVKLRRVQAKKAIESIQESVMYFFSKACRQHQPIHRCIS